jgi:hypothetical protein
MSYTCPVCFYDGLPEPPENYEICVCCGTEFGNDDEFRSHAELREEWIRNGCAWFFQQPPAGWSASAQLARGIASAVLPDARLKARTG